MFTMRPHSSLAAIPLFPFSAAVLAIKGKAIAARRTRALDRCGHDVHLSFDGTPLTPGNVCIGFTAAGVGFGF